MIPLEGSYFCIVTSRSECHLPQPSHGPRHRSPAMVIPMWYVCLTRRRRYPADVCGTRTCLCSCPVAVSPQFRAGTSSVPAQTLAVHHTRHSRALVAIADIYGAVLKMLISPTWFRILSLRPEPEKITFLFHGILSILRSVYGRDSHPRTSDRVFPSPLVSYILIR